MIEDNSYEIPIPEIPEIESFPKSPSVNSLTRKNSQSFYSLISKHDFAYLVTKNQEDFVVIDARFDYEYQGGHIKGAHSINNQKQIEELYNKYQDKKPTLIFHCEFSHDRAPALINYFRSYDRRQNIYPNLTYENIYLLEGGYSHFYEEYPHLCTGGYTKMFDKEFTGSGQLQQSQNCFNQEFRKTPSISLRHRIARCRSSGDNLYESFYQPSLLSKPLFQ